MAEPVLKAADAPKPADPLLKVVPPQPTAKRTRASTLAGVFKQNRRLMLLVVLPLIAAVIALTVFLMGGRYITTDNSYVGAQKVLITPDIAGKISRVVVAEGQQVSAGDVLFEIDPVPFRIAVTQGEGKLAAVRVEFANLKSNLQSLGQLITISRNTVQLRQNDVDRKATLLANRYGSATDADNSMAALQTARMQIEQLTQQEAQIRNQLLGDAELPIEQYPAFAQAQAALDQARRDLEHTVLRAPISGVATQVDAIQLGRYVAAGTPVFSIMDNARPWVDANPKETDITFLKIGQKAWVHIDTFPGHVFRGTVVSVSPGTGAQFAILPPQNASGNWVKVVQRVPVRIQLDPSQNFVRLRAGMSATVEIDTLRRRTFWSLFGDTEVVAEKMQ